MWSGSERNASQINEKNYRRHARGLAISRLKTSVSSGQIYMKVVLFCGGLGTRLGELTENIDKQLVKSGYRPIMWHVMKYYAHFGHKDFILCLGYRADTIKDYFLNYKEYLSNDFTMSNGGKDIQLMQSDIADWKITFVDTGLRANIGQRPKAVEKYPNEQEIFLPNYSSSLPT